MSITKPKSTESLRNTSENTAHLLESILSSTQTSFSACNLRKVANLASFTSAEKCKHVFFSLHMRTERLALIVT